MMPLSYSIILPYKTAIAEFMCLQLLLQISRSYLETCIMAGIHIEQVHEAHVTLKMVK